MRDGSRIGPKGIEATEATCGQCGRRIPPNAPLGQCPVCLWDLGRADAVLEFGDEFGPQLRAFGDFELLEEIARGGMGVIYRAWQRSLKREVALKMILAGELADPEARQRFRIEAEAAARLQHPHIVPVFAVGETDGHHFFTMRLVAGGRNLANWGQQLKRTGVERARAVARQMQKVVEAVAFAHERGVLHRDLKPSNILIDPGDEPQVTDFGLAKLLDAPGGDMTVGRAMLGSPSYMAPEQVRDLADGATTLTDVYGLGAILYELLAGHPPFQDRDPLEVARKVVEEDPAPLRGVPADLANICLRCLRKAPGDRYVSAAELLQDLDAFLAGKPVIARPLGTPARMLRLVRRYPFPTALAVTMVVGFVVFPILWLRGERALQAERAVVDRMQWEQIDQWLAQDKGSLALAQLAARLREDPKRWQAAVFAQSIVEQRPFPYLAYPPEALPGALGAPPRLLADGRHVLLAFADGEVRLFQLGAGFSSGQGGRLASPAKDVQLMAGETRAVFCCADGSIALWDLAPGGGLAPWEMLPVAAGEAPGRLLAAAADAEVFFVGSEDGLRGWSGQKGEAVQPLADLESPEGLHELHLSRDGTRLLAVGRATARVWEVPTGHLLAEIAAERRFEEGHLDPTGQLVALIDRGGFRVTVREALSGAQRWRYEAPDSQIRTMSFDHDGDSLLFSLVSNQVLLGHPREGTTRILDRGHHYDPRWLQASPDGRWVASLSLDGRVRLWETEEGVAPREPIVSDPQRGLPALAVGAGGRRIVLVHAPTEAGEGARLEVWDYTREQTPWQTPPLGGQGFNTATLSEDGRSIVVGTWPESRAVVIDTETGDIVLDRSVAGDVYVSLFSPDQRRLYVLTGNGWRYGWDLASGAALWPPRQESGLIRPAALSPDGEWIVAGHDHGLLRVYATATGDLIHELPHDGRPTVLYFVPDGSGRFVSAATNREAYLWQVETGEKLVSYAGHRRSISAGTFSDDGRWLATGTHNGDVLVHAVDSGQRQGARPIQHLGDVPTMDFQPGSDLLAVGSRDGVVRLWDTRTRQPASPPLEQGASILTVRFTADGRRLLAIDHFGFRFWDAASGLPVSVHYPGSVPSGTGMDSPSYHAFLTPDGSRVLRNDHRDVFNLWSVPVPPGPGEEVAVPAWFPDLLERLAAKRLDSSGEPEACPAEDLPALRRELASAAAEPADRYTRWARRILWIDGPP